MLFYLRGNPTHRDFVTGLNQIDIVFEDSSEVLTAWGKLYDTLNNPPKNNALQTLDLLRTDLLSVMAEHLGYQKLKQTDIQRNYIPQAHLDHNDSVINQNAVMKSFFESGTKMHNLWISHYNPQTSQTEENK